MPSSLLLAAKYPSYRLRKASFVAIFCTPGVRVHGGERTEQKSEDWFAEPFDRA